MVEASQLDDLNRRLTGPFKLAIVAIDQLDILQKNARFMKSEMFQQLVKNIERDGALSSIPFCYLDAETARYRVLSGNHRVDAAKKAGLTELLIMYTDRPLTRAEQVAIQLSHNAIEGEDDKVVLRSLYQEIDDLALKAYAGLSDKLAQELEAVDLAALSEARLDFALLTFTFLPDDVRRLKAVFKDALEEADADVLLARWAEYDRTLNALAKVKTDYNVWNGATALMLVLDVFERHVEDLRSGWLADDHESARHKNSATVASVFGAETIPTATAVKVHRALERMIGQGQLEGKARWKALDQWADAALRGKEGA